MRKAISCNFVPLSSKLLRGAPRNDEKTVFERSRVIAVAIDARQQYFPNEKRYQYEPFVGLEDDYRWNQENYEKIIRDYNLQDLAI